MKLYTNKEVADLTGLSIQRVKQASKLYAEKVGSVWIWNDDGIKKLLERKGKVGTRLN